MRKKINDQDHQSILGLPQTHHCRSVALDHVFGFQLKNLRFETDTNANLPQNDPAFVYNDLVEDIFNSKDVFIVSIFEKGPEGIFNPQTLALVERLTERIKELDGVIEKDVMSLSTIKNIVGTTAGFRVGRFMKTVPETPGEIRELKEALYENDTYIGSILSADGQATSIFAKMEGDRGKWTGVYHDIKKLLSLEPAGGRKFYVAGRPVLEVTFGIYMQQSMEKMFPLVILVIVLMLYGVFRGLRGVLLPLFIVIGADIWAMGIMAMCGVPMYLFSTIMPIILMAIGIADGIHVLEKYYQLVGGGLVTDRRSIVKETFAEMWSPVVMTSLTTAAGFVSLVSNQMVSIRAFGLFTAVGVIAAMIFSLTLLPATLAMLKAKGPKRVKNDSLGKSGALDRGFFGFALTRLGKIMYTQRGKVLAALAVVFAFCLYGLTLLTSEGSWMETLQEESEVRIADRALNSKFDGTVRLNVVFEGVKQYDMQSPEVLKAMAELQKDLARDEAVGGSISLADFIQRMNQVMNEGRREFRVVPDSQELIAQYLFLYSMSGEPGDFDEYVDYDYRLANVIFFLKTDHSRATARVVDRVNGFFSRHKELKGLKINMAGAGFLTLAWVESLVRGQLWSIVSSLVAVFLITSLMFRSWAAGLINGVSIAGAMLINFGLLSLAGQPLEVSAAISSGIIIGIGVDYTIHFIYRYRLAVAQNNDSSQATLTTMITSGRAITFNALVVIAGFMVLFASDFTPSVTMGVHVAIGMFVCFLMAMTFLPAILNTFKPRFIFS